MTFLLLKLFDNAKGAKMKSQGITIFLNFTGKAAQNSRDNHDIVVETFQVTPRQLTDWLTAGGRTKNDKV